MKAFSFKSKTSTLRVLKEPVIKKKRMSFDRALYLIIIALAMFLFLRYIVIKTTIIKADGQVMMHKIDVNFTHDIRLLEYNVSEGDTIKQHQKLFSYIEDQLDNDALGILSYQEDEATKAKALLELDFKISSQRIKIKAMKDNLALLQSEYDKTTELVLLDVYTIDKLNEITSKIGILKTQLALLYNELALLNRQKKNIPSLEINAFNYGSSGGQLLNSIYNAPIGGVIGQISVSEKETCYRTESVLTIHDTDKVFIKGYFKLDDLKDIHVNDEVTIEFPDNTFSSGIINKYYVSTYAMPEEFQKTYEPTERSIVVEIAPLNIYEAEKWAKYHKLNITISKYKYDLDI